MSLLTKSTPTPPTSCPPDLSNDVDDLTYNLQQRDMIIQQQKQQLQHQQQQQKKIRYNNNNENNNNIKN
jgi:hypothetical protein